MYIIIYNGLALFLFVGLQIYHTFSFHTQLLCFTVPFPWSSMYINNPSLEQNQNIAMLFFFLFLFLC